MPRHTHLLRRGSRYYLNVKIPKDLRAAFGKELIRKALDTSDPNEAARLVRFESFRLDAEFAAKRREQREAIERQVKPASPLKISDREAHDIVCEFFVNLEKLAEQWSEDDLPKMGDGVRREVLADLQADATASSGGSGHVLEDDGTHDLENFLTAKGWTIARDTSAYTKLRALFRRARRENTLRTIDRVLCRDVMPRETVFRDVFSHTPAKPVRAVVTLGEMLKRFTQTLADAGRSAGTLRTYEIPCRILREVLGENTSLDSITKDDIERLFKLLQRAPANATKRYHGMTLAQAAEAADKRNDPHRLAGKTLGNYFNNVVAVFNFAVEKRLLVENPARDRYLRETFERGAERKKKAQFTIGELNRLFRAPLYTGCRDDENGYATAGESKPRRARFWLPLVGLFHGFRSNEAAQLYTEDVAEIDGIPVFKIRATLDGSDASDKRLKSRQSERNVPIHPELLRIGFLDYIAERRSDATNPRLFPDNPRGANGYYSSPFGKWFGRFVEKTLGETCKATFHSFRHHFRDAMREAELSTDYVEALGGWGDDKRSAERLYGKGPSLKRLREQIEKVNYPDLDLSHLHPVSNQRACRVRVRSRPPAV